ncbi:hypothetical protein D3C85_1400830 [compost metagenome]
MAVGITEELAIDRPVAQQVEHRGVLRQWVVQVQDAFLGVVARLLQALALGVELDHHLAHVGALAQRLALQAQHGGRGDGDRLLVGLALAAEYHRVLADLDQLLLLGGFLAQGEVVRRQELGVHRHQLGSPQGQAQRQGQAGPETQGNGHRQLRSQTGAPL